MRLHVVPIILYDAIGELDDALEHSLLVVAEGNVGVAGNLNRYPSYNHILQHHSDLLWGYLVILYQELKGHDGFGKGLGRLVVFFKEEVLSAPLPFELRDFLLVHLHSTHSVRSHRLCRRQALHCSPSEALPIPSLIL